MADSSRSSVYHTLGGGAVLPGDGNESFVYPPLITCTRNSFVPLIESCDLDSHFSFPYFVNRLHIIKIGAVADVLLWRKWTGGLVLLVTATVFWLLFERAGYNILQFVSNVLLLLVAILFFWAKSASILNRPLPPLPDLEVSEEVILKAFDGMHMWINHALLVARDLAIHGNLKVLIQVVSGLLVISYIGSLFNFLTLVYIGVLLSLSVPLLYEKYQDEIDDKLIIAHKVMQTQLRKLDENILRKIPMPKNKEKKTH